MRLCSFLAKRNFANIILIVVIVFVCAVWAIIGLVRRKTLAITDNNKRSIDAASSPIRQADIINSFGSPVSVIESQDSVLLLYDGASFELFSPGGLQYSLDEYVLGKVSLTGESFSVRGIKKGSSLFSVKLAFLFNPSQDATGKKYTVGPMYDPKSVELEYDENNKVSSVVIRFYG